METRRGRGRAWLHAGLLLLALVCALPSGAAGAASGETAEEGTTSLFWSIARDGERVGYLLGTVHSEDPRVLDFPDAFVEQITDNRFFAMEMVPDLPTLARLTEYMHYQDGTRLADVAGEERYARLQQALAGYSVPPDWVERMKVWAAMMTLSVPPSSTGFFMDLSLSLRAAGAGLKVVGLETLEQQLAFLEDMPVEQQLELLDHALAEYERVDSVHRALVDTYLSNDPEALLRLSEEQMAELDAEVQDYFMAQGVDARNHRMLESLLAWLGEGTVFAAVGALHLPGENGLVALLRQQGFELRPLPFPLSVPETRRQAGQHREHEAGDAPGGFDEHGGQAQHREQQAGGDAVAEAVGQGDVAPGQLEQQVVQAELAAAVEDQW